MATVTTVEAAETTETVVIVITTDVTIVATIVEAVEAIVAVTATTIVGETTARVLVATEMPRSPPTRTLPITSTTTMTSSPRVRAAPEAAPRDVIVAPATTLAMATTMPLWLSKRRTTPNVPPSQAETKLARWKGFLTPTRRKKGTRSISTPANPNVGGRPF